MNIGTPHELTILEFAKAVQRLGRRERTSSSGRCRRTTRRCAARHHARPGRARLGAEGRASTRACGGPSPGSASACRRRERGSSMAKRSPHHGRGGVHRLPPSRTRSSRRAGTSRCSTTSPAASARTCPRGARFYPVDVRSASRAEAIAKERPQVICHQAAQIDVRRSMADPRFDADVNVGGLLNLMQAAVEAGSVEHVLFASSGGATYGDTRRHPDARGAPAAPALALRRRQGRERALPGRLPGELRDPVHGAAVLQRVRPAAGPARRGRGGGDLLRAAAGGQPVHDLRRWRPDPRLRLRRRRGPRELARGGAALRGAAQHRHWRRRPT